MLVLSHRGYWLNKDEHNTAIAFKRSFDLNFGTETDLRDYGSKIVIAHDIPNGNEIIFEDLLDIMANRNLWLALNIKSNGLGTAILDILKKYNHTNYFTFDMALPDLIAQMSKNICAFTGLSDIQTIAPLLNEASGVWLDSFTQDWFDSDLLDNILQSSKKLCIVSAELHKRPPNYQWQIIKKCKYLQSKNLMICTDKPQEAEDFFND